MNVNVMHVLFANLICKWMVRIPRTTSIWVNVGRKHSFKEAETQPAVVVSVQFCSLFFSPKKANIICHFYLMLCCRNWTLRFETWNVVLTRQHWYTYLKYWYETHMGFRNISMVYRNMQCQQFLRNNLKVFYKFIFWPHTKIYSRVSVLKCSGKYLAKHWKPWKRRSWFDCLHKIRSLQLIGKFNINITDTNNRYSFNEPWLSSYTC